MVYIGKIMIMSMISIMMMMVMIMSMLSIMMMMMVIDNDIQPFDRNILCFPLLSS